MIMFSSKLVITLQQFFLAADLTINCVVAACNIEFISLLVLFLAQDLMLIFSIILIFIGLLSKYQYQLVHSQIVSRGFALPILVFLEYIALTIAFQILILQLRWDQTDQLDWTEGLHALYVLQRASSFLYYFSYNKTVFLLLDI